ncbi:glycogen debranching protein [Butyrivibrio sp. JL13D10]|uniref:glycogen debranching protein n=1 Tax=Butyrivibrio sp. JL13D10 TaxID=3236815 RepID=UPI0038B5A39D
MQRIDEFPTHELNGVKYRIGRPMPFGAEVVSDNCVNFSIYSKDATKCELLLYHRGDKKPYLILELKDEFRLGSVYSVMIFDIDWEETEYGYRFDGPNDISQGFRFNPSKILLDPYAKLVSGCDKWHQYTYADSDFKRRGRIIREDYNWEGDRPLEIAPQDLVIYEMHVRGFTKHDSSGVKYKGTYAGIVEKIPYLKKLGVNCIELLPTFEFEEFIPGVPEDCCNYWGYVTCNYFSPKTGYAYSGPQGLAVDEMKNMIKKLHQNGIAIVLDIVFNHTGEYGDEGEYISFRGIDNRTYYIMNSDGTYSDLTGCRNTVNCNNPIVRNFIIDSLRYWVSSYHIDGFRVDEAPIFVRGQDGEPLLSPPLMESLADDPILSHTMLISEGWDPSGLSTIGNFTNTWADWNARTRDAIKRFIKGGAESGPDIIRSIEGSPDMFANGTPASSVNYIISHDGFTLYDTVSYQQTHNETNALPSPMDHDYDNCSWNCGAEGDTDDKEINALRKRQMKNAMTILLLARGIPMLLAGDEFANTQYGNNNAFSQDNEISWLDWDRLKKYKDVFEYVRRLISFRKEHPVIRREIYYSDYNSSGYPELSWHGVKAWEIDRYQPFLVFGFMYAEPKADFKVKNDCFIYCGINSHWEEHILQLPIIPEGMEWRIVLYSGDETGKMKNVVCKDTIKLMPRSSMVLIGTY